MTGYCLKCKKSREIQEAEQVMMKNGRSATRGKCGASFVVPASSRRK